MAIESIDTEGPDITDSPKVVPQGRLQVELGGEWHRTRDAGTDVSTPSLVRYGLTDHWEFRLAPEGYVRESGASGMGDTALGVKWQAYDAKEGEALPSLGWILHLTLPTGAQSVRGRGARPSLHVTLSWDLPHEWDVGVMPGVEVDDDDAGRRFAYGVFGLVAGKHITENLRLFGEFSGERLASSAHGGSIAEWDAGASYLLGTETLVGFRLATGVNRRSPERALVLEIAHRF